MEAGSLQEGGAYYSGHHYQVDTVVIRAERSELTNHSLLTFYTAFTHRKERTFTPRSSTLLVKFRRSVCNPSRELHFGRFELLIQRCTNHEY